jgi:hypothetical protein
MGRVQKLLLDKLGIQQLLAVIGGSIGGMQVLQWAIAYPEFVKAAIAIATTSHLGAQSIAFDAVGRNAILADQNFADGQYPETGGPDRGLAIARTIGHITYLSEESMRQKFGRQLRTSDRYSYDFNSEFAVETYLDYQGQTFVERFDANSYLYITKAADYFDLGREYGTLTKAFANVKARFLVVSFTSAYAVGSRDVLVGRGLRARRQPLCWEGGQVGLSSFLVKGEDGVLWFVRGVGRWEWWKYFGGESVAEGKELWEDWRGWIYTFGRSCFVGGKELWRKMGCVLCGMVRRVCYWCAWRAYECGGVESVFWCVVCIVMFVRCVCCGVG